MGSSISDQVWIELIDSESMISCDPFPINSDSNFYLQQNTIIHINSSTTMAFDSNSPLTITVINSDSDLLKSSTAQCARYETTLQDWNATQCVTTFSDNLITCACACSVGSDDTGIFGIVNNPGGDILFYGELFAQIALFGTIVIILGFAVILFFTVRHFRNYSVVCFILFPIRH